MINVPFQRVIKMKEPTHAYIGICRKCGNVHSMIADYEETKAVAEWVSDMIKNGLIVNRVTIEECRKVNFSTCKAVPIQKGLFDE